MTALRPDTGARVAARNPDVRARHRTGRRRHVRAGHRRALPRGRAVRPGQDAGVRRGRRPGPARPAAAGGLRLRLDRARRPPARASSNAVPDEATDRLTVLSPDPADAEKPEEEFSVLLPVEGATVVALTSERVAVALPDPPRLQLLDRDGAEVGLVDLDVPEADLATDPPGGVPELSTGPGSERPDLLVDRLPHDRPRPGRSHPALDAAGHARARPALRRRPAGPGAGRAARRRPGHRRRAAHHPGSAGTTGPARCGWPPPVRSCWSSADPRSSRYARP